MGKLFGKRSKMLKEKKLLVLSHTYNSFIKDPVEILAKDFNKIYVLVRYQPIAEFGNYIPLGMFKSRKKYSKRYSIDLTDKPENVEVIPVPLWYLPFNFFYKYVGSQHARKVLKILKKRNIKFDIIHAHFAWSAGYAGMKVKEKYKKPLIITGHGYDVYDMPFRSSAWEGRVKDVLRSADQITTVSSYNKKAIAKLGFKDNVHLILNGFKKNLFNVVNRQEARRKLAFPKDKKIILTIGNLEKIKGYDVLIEALRKVKEKNKNFLCIHIGAGTEEKKIKNLIKKYGLERNVKLLGRKPHNELNDWYGACDFFVSSSLFEGNPTVMFESLGCGKPFIGTKVGGIPDIVNSEDYGKLAEPNNADELAENILWAFDRTWDSEKIANYAQKYAWENVVKEISKLYKQLL